MRMSHSLVLAVALTLSGCATMNGAEDVGDRTEQLRAQLHADASLMYVTCDVRGDTAYLSGWAPNYAARSKAEEPRPQDPRRDEGLQLDGHRLERSPHSAWVTLSPAGADTRP